MRGLRTSSNMTKLGFLFAAEFAILPAFESCECHASIVHCHNDFVICISEFAGGECYAPRIIVD